MSSPPPWKVGDKGVVQWPARSPILLFYSYAPADASLYAELEKHVTLLHRGVAVWHAGIAAAGTDATQEAAKRLEEANVIIILVTADYFFSDSLFYGEMRRAMERHEADEARVIPVLARHCDLALAPLAKLSRLPTDGSPVSAWSDRDEAWTDVAIGVRRAVEAYRALPRLRGSRLS